MSYKKVCSLDELWEGDMVAFELDGQELLVVRHDGGEIDVFQGTCPHQDIPLVEGTLKNGTITCRAHLWQFDARHGQGINPACSHLARYPSLVKDGELLVDTTGVTPYTCPA